MARRTPMVPLVGNNPLVHLAGVAQGLEENYAASEHSAYASEEELRRLLEAAAQACALFDVIEQIEFTIEDNSEYRKRLEGYRVELALRYKKKEDPEDG